MLADFIPAFNLANLGISLLVIVITAFAARLAGYAKIFIEEIPKYKHLPRHPKTWAILDLYDQKGGFENTFIPGMRNEDQSFKPIVNLGPWGDGHTYTAVSDAQAFRTILPDMVNFPKMPASYRWFSTLTGAGLLVATGEQHRIQRKRVTPLFHLAVLKKSVPVMVDITKELLRFLKEKKSDFHPAKSLFALHAMRVVVNLAFGGDFKPEWMLETWERVEHAFNDWTFGWCVFGPIWNYLPFEAASGFKKARQSICDALAEAIEKRRVYMQKLEEEGKELEEHDHNNLLCVLLGSTKLNGDEWTTEEIVDQAITFLFAGHDTSSVALAWSMYFMAKHSECFAKLREEADRVLGDRDPTAEDLNELLYTKNFMKEVLRLRPPVPIIDRIAMNDCEVGGQKVPAGTYLGMFLWNVGRDSRYYKNPDEFDPERWNDNPPDPFSSVPFSAGPRNCIGNKFSLQEITIAISMIARELDIAYDTTQNVVAAFEGVVAPKGLSLKFSERVDMPNF